MYRLLNDVSLDQQLESTIYCPSHGGDQYRHREDLAHPSHPIPTFKLKSILSPPSLLPSPPPFRPFLARCRIVHARCMSVDCRL